MAKLSSGAAGRIRQLAATFLKTPAPQMTKPLKIASTRPGRQPSPRQASAQTKSSYAK